MKKWGILVFLSTFHLTLIGWAALPSVSTAPVLVSSATKFLPIVFSSVSNRAFSPPEKLTFAIKYEFITAGTSVMDVQEGPVVNGRRTMNIISQADSNGFVDKLFKVRDYNASLVDRDSLVSLNFHQNLHEGGYQVMRNTALDYQNHEFRFERLRRGTTSNKSGEINEPLFDILSAFYYARTLPLTPGKNYSIRVFTDDEIYPLLIRVATDTEKVNVPAGTFDCIRVDPFVHGDAIFQAKEGRMTIWLTNDDRKMPVLIRSRVFIGAVDAELVDYKINN